MARVKQYKTNDLDLRIAVVQQLLAEGLTRRDIRHELTLDSHSSGGRADIIVFGKDDRLQKNFIGGIEIKSGRDVLDRCDDQGDSYGRAFDRMIYVIDKRHCQAIGDKLGPYSSGRRYIIYCHDKGGFYRFHTVDGDEIVEARKQFYEGGTIHKSYKKIHQVNYDAPVKNLSQFSAGWAGSVYECGNHALGMAQLLWADEINRIAGKLGLVAKKHTRCALIDVFQESCSLKDLRPLVSHELQTRTPSQWEINFWKKFDELHPPENNV